MLKLDSVRAGYGKVTVLKGLTLEVQEGEVVCLVGANGAGKTTTLRAICGLIGLEAGDIQWQGTSLKPIKANRRVNLGITLVPEGRQLFPHMTVKENLLLGSFHTGAREGALARMEEVLDLFPRVRERLWQTAGSLSGGEQQMVAIARGLMSNPKLLMFDEPSLGLAPMLVKQVFEIIDTIVSRGTTVLIVEQNVYHTLSIANRGYVIENGEIVMSDTGPALLASPHVKAAYLGI